MIKSGRQCVFVAGSVCMWQAVFGCVGVAGRVGVLEAMCSFGRHCHCESVGGSVWVLQEVCVW